MKPQPYRKEKMPRRNDRCPCGSGKKAKRCCLASIQSLAALPPHLREQVVVAKILGHIPASVEARASTPPSGNDPVVVQIEGGIVTTEDSIAVQTDAGSVDVQIEAAYPSACDLSYDGVQDA